MLITYLLIIVPSVLFIIYICNDISPILVIFAVISTVSLVITYSFAACSDPGKINNLVIDRIMNIFSGIIYRTPQNRVVADVESGESSPINSTITAATISGLMYSNFQRYMYANSNFVLGDIECTQCNIRRPRSSMHCYVCGVCVDEASNKTIEDFQ
jgi:hypothetical protein